MMPFDIQPLYVVSGFAVGFLVGMTGVGGGSLMTPILILLFNVHPVTAVGTDLLFASATKSAGSIVHRMTRNIDWGIVSRLALGSIPAALVTLAALRLLQNDQPAANTVVTHVLGFALLATALALVFRRYLLASYARHIGKLDERQTFSFTVLTGMILGILVSISSVGAGALGVTALVLLYPDRPVVKIVASDIAHAVPLTLVAGLGHLMNSGIDVNVLEALLMGSLPGVVIASALAPKLPDLALRTILALVLAVSGLRLVI